tara:strand:+ start:39 stop:461 length:423 start_codon:yes stop_codon:yes gene_type:complete
MAASIWHKITNITDADLAGSLTLKGGTMMIECNIDLNGTTEVYTKPFDFSIAGDLSIVINSGSENITDTYLGANCEIGIQGSVDGANYVDLDATTNKDFDTKPYVHIYDYDAKGRMPYMRISLDGHGSGTEDIKIAIIPH